MTPTHNEPSGIRTAGEAATTRLQFAEFYPGGLDSAMHGLMMRVRTRTSIVDRSLRVIGDGSTELKRFSATGDPMRLSLATSLLPVSGTLKGLTTPE